ncbi:MAG: hypothetical protein IJV56_00390 [Neisseriaceae bacterium]|nr:hypothetical protein [Neisseriaceae bacterium]
MKNLYLNCIIHTIFFDIAAFLCFVITTDCYHTHLVAEYGVFFIIEWWIFFALLGFGKMMKWQHIYLSLIVIAFFIGKFFIYAFAEAISVAP